MSTFDRYQYAKRLHLRVEYERAEKPIPAELSVFEIAKHFQLDEQEVITDLETERVEFTL